MRIKLNIKNLIENLILEIKNPIFKDTNNKIIRELFQTIIKIKNWILLMKKNY